MGQEGWGRGDLSSFSKSPPHVAPPLPRGLASGEPALFQGVTDLNRRRFSWDVHHAGLTRFGKDLCLLTGLVPTTTKRSN